jgi:hypothetical protein
MDFLKGIATSPCWDLRNVLASLRNLAFRVKFRGPFKVASTKCYCFNVPLRRHYIVYGRVLDQKVIIAFDNMISASIDRTPVATVRRPSKTNYDQQVSYERCAGKDERSGMRRAFTRERI